MNETSRREGNDKDAIDRWNEGTDAECGADLDLVVSASKRRKPRFQRGG
ncbi:MAG TPA: hypothetical protein VH575_30735 [Gemmataceae bacterium]|jgi:hypothetical protein